MHGAGARNACFLRGLVVRVPGAAVLAAHLPDRVTVRIERERLLEELAARPRIGVGPDAVEPLEGELARNLRVVGDQRVVRRRHHRELELEAFRILEAKAPLVAVDRDALAGEAVVPELNRILGGDAEDDPVDHPAAGSAGPRLWVLEERQVAAGAALFVR